MPENRLITLGNHGHTETVCLDQPGAGGACHVYRVQSHEHSGHPQVIFSDIRFQNGPVKTAGVNGLHNEDLLAIVQDRLENFQRGKFACMENGQALTAIREALEYLNYRTTDRQLRGVEGTNEK